MGGQIILSPTLISNLKYKGTCGITNEQDKIFSKYDGKEIWNHIYNDHEICDYVCG